MNHRMLLATLLLLSCIRPVGAGPLLDWLHPYGPHGNISCCPKLPCCPDNYCAKPYPCISCLPRCGGPDDYCAKPYPCIPCLPRCGGPDDYCAKPYPCFFCPTPSPYLSCGSQECCPSRPGVCPTCGK